jgi:hypothetical protein
VGISRWITTSPARGGLEGPFAQTLGKRRRKAPYRGPHVYAEGLGITITVLDRYQGDPAHIESGVRSSK